ncbi:MAG: hypothetical protein LUE29_03855 [Lachnospiraceae bacterium]|nr:hypothetical protein [Lachnospiraceae bacterium]
MKILFENNVPIPEQKYVVSAGECFAQVEVPDGAYMLRVYAGDPNDSGDMNVYVKINGADMPPIWVGDRTVSQREYEAHTVDGKISMEFSGSHVMLHKVEFAKKIETAPVITGSEPEFHADIRGWENELSWSRKNGRSYENVHIYKWEPQGDGDPEILETENTGCYIDDDVRLCRTYEYKICYADELGFEGPWSEPLICEIADESFFKARVRELYICGETAESVTLAWQIDGNATCCNVYRKSAWGNFKKIATIPGGGPSVTWKDEHVYTDHPYTYYVEAESFGGVSKGAKVTSIVMAEPRRRQMEALDRGLVAVRTADGVFLSWRMMPRETEEGIGFLLRLNGQPCFAQPHYGASNYFLSDEEIRGILKSKQAESDPENGTEPILAKIEEEKSKTGAETEKRTEADLQEQKAGSCTEADLQKVEAGSCAEADLQKVEAGSCAEKDLCDIESESCTEEDSRKAGTEREELIFEILTVDRTGRVLTPADYDISDMGMYLDRGCTASVWEHNFLEIPLDKPEPYLAPDGQRYEYTANDASAADLDGDGAYEIILKWDCNGKDNAHRGYSGICLLDAYKLDGTRLWRISLGPNIRCGAHYTQFLAYDFDGDGCAELIFKTADGTVDGTGQVIGDAAADFRNSDGYILEGPEYLTLFDGRTGRALDTVPYVPDRGTVSEYGDSWGNRVDRFLACVAYLDGVHPSAVMCRGYYDHGRPTNLAAWDVREKKLHLRWTFRADAAQNIRYTNQGFHNLAVADVDGDGCDEIIYGACVIDDDGTGLYSTGLGHGDAMHVGRFTAESEGFDYYGIHEHAECPYGMEAHDAGTGLVRWGKYTGRDTGRGLVAKIDPRRPGCQMWAMPGDGLYNYKDGAEISANSPESVNFAVWWDGDLLRELFDHEWHGYGSGISIPRVYKWNWERESLDTLLSADECAANNGSKGNPCLQASLFGDWREELVLRTKDSTALRIYTTTSLTEHRFYTFMADETYRLGIAWQNTAYNQPPQTSFYIGDDMGELPVPRHRYIQGR